MPEEETRYVTLNGKVPNGGVPPGRMFASVAFAPSGPYPSYHPFTPGPFSGGYAPPPPYHSPRNHAPPPPGPPSHGSLYEPPGQYLDSRIMHGPGYTYLLPSEHTTIHFVHDASRPCDYPGGYYPHPFDFTTHKVATMITVRELLKILRCPPGDQNGITEMIALPNFRFVAAETVTWGSDDVNKTLGQMGWTQRRSGPAPIWILVKR